MKLLILLWLVTTVLVVAACGESQSGQAQAQVCDARADIQSEVSQLQSLTLSTATANGVRDSLNAIKSALQKMSDAQSQLRSERRQQVQSANEQFVSKFRSVVNDLGSNLSISGAEAQLQDAGQQLATAYRAAFAKLDC